MYAFGDSELENAMGSKSLFVKCKTCGTEIAKNAKSCPKCGAKNKKSVILKIILGIVGFIILIGIFAPSEDEKPTNANSTKQPEQQTAAQVVSIPKPQNQLSFESIVIKFTVLYKKADNELKKSAIRLERKNALQGSGIPHNITNWVGTLVDLSTNSDGKAYITIRIHPDIEIKTWNNALSDISDNTLIEQTSELYKKLMNMKKGQKVKFSGVFVLSDNDFFKETSMTESGAMESPEFLLRFTDVHL